MESLNNFKSHSVFQSSVNMFSGHLVLRMPYPVLLKKNKLLKVTSTSTLFPSSQMDFRVQI